MCLDIVKKIYAPNDDMVVAYKIFYESQPWKNQYGEGITLSGQFRYNAHKEGVYYKSSNGRIGNRGMKYESGFHAYTFLSAAKRRCNSEPFYHRHRDEKCIYEVLLWNITAKGEQFNENVVVAKNMRIMRKVK